MQAVCSKYTFFNDPAVKTTVLSVLEKQLNRVLALDPVTVVQLGEMAGAVIDIHCSEPQFRCYVYLEKQGVRLVGYHEGDTDACIRGSIGALLALVSSRDQAIDTVPGIELLGNQAILIRLSAVHQSVELDWESLFCQCFGDVGGHFLAKWFQGTSRQVEKITATIADNCQEYLQEELALLPSRNEFDAFSADIVELQMKVDVLAEKLVEKIEGLNDDRQAGV